MTLEEMTLEQMKVKARHATDRELRTIIAMLQGYEDDVMRIEEDYQKALRWTIITEEEQEDIDKIEDRINYLYFRRTHAENLRGICEDEQSRRDDLEELMQEIA